MAKINNTTNVYSPNILIVDATGNTPFKTITSAFATAVSMGLTDVEIYIRPGTYTENLTLVDNFFLAGSSYEEVTIEGTHTIPMAGNVGIQNITFKQSTPATDIFTETGASVCQLRFDTCYFYPHSGSSFNLPTSTGLINLYRCNGSAVTSDSVYNNAAGGFCYILNSHMGKGAVSLTCNGGFLLRNGSLRAPLALSGTADAQIICSQVYSSITTSDTADIKIYASQLLTGVNTPITANVGSIVQLNNVVIDSSAANIATGAGSVSYGEVTCLDSVAHNATTEDYTTRVITGSLQLDEGNAGVMYSTAGVVGSTAALTNGQMLIGNTGNAPSVASLTAGAGISVTPGAGTVTIASTVSMDFITIGADGALTTSTRYINTKAALLTVSLPAVSAQGTTMILQGYGAGGWIITQAANQQILIGNTNTTLGAGGTLASTDKGDAVSLVCTTANLEWRVFSMVGNLTVV